MEQNSNNQIPDNKQFDNKELKPKKNKMKYPIIFLLIGLILVSLGGIIGFMAAIRASKTYAISYGTKEYMTEALQEVKGKVKEISSKVEKKSNDKKSIINDSSLESFDSIIININHPNVKITQSDNYSIFCEYTKYTNDYEVSYKVKDNTLTVTDNNIKNNFSFDFNDDNSDYINIFVPSPDIKDINIKTTSGDVEIENIKSKNSITISSTSGYIDLDDITSNSIILNTVSGDFDLENIISKTLNLNGISSYTKLSEIDNEILKFQTVSGDIEVENTTTNKFTGSTVSGNINFNGSLSDANLSSTSGNVYILTDKNINSYNHDLSSISGTIEVDGEGYRKNINTTRSNNENSIKVSTTSGSIILTSDN